MVGLTAARRPRTEGDSMRTSRLTMEQWRLARRRWEGSPNVGFQWLANEVAVAWGIELTRVAFQNVAKRDGWAHGGEASDPLPIRAPTTAPVAPAARVKPNEACDPSQAAVKALHALSAALTGNLAGATVVVLVLPAATRRK